ncbi:MAG: ATP-binding protein [Bdellovibrionales bacterium]
MMEQTRVIGHVVAIYGFRLKVELSPDAKSSSRATPDGVQRAVAINSFLTFDLGAGTYAIGMLSDLEARESYDPTQDKELSLELTKPRRIASVQLLGTVKQDGKREWKFDTGITVLPTLDTPAEVASPDILSGIFACPPKRNRPHSSTTDDYDFPLDLGHQTGNEDVIIKASFNDLFSRPLAVVGNTGSGKSYTVASLLRGIIELERFSTISDAEPHVFILDINGEYANAFLDKGRSSYTREPNKIYLNGEEFCVPAWLMNGEEVCEWLQASEATQEPVLKDWWAIAKSKQMGIGSYDPLQIAIQKIDGAIGWLDKNSPKSAFKLALDHAKQYAPDEDWDSLTALPKWSDDTSTKKDDWAKITNDKEVRDSLGKFRGNLLEKISIRQQDGINFARTADSPRFVALNDFRDPNLVDRSTDIDGSKKIDQYLLTLKLRLRTRLDDRRWQSFFSYEQQNVHTFENWIEKMGIGQKNGWRISILDLSMLASEVLPFVCALIGRLLLETREMLRPDVRSKYPWVLVLEEAHNYARPSALAEDRGQTLSRRAFERIAKEGRKFGLSLIVASQRPSEISPTIVSQCANFFAHRLQNPDDIEHFRRIIPKQAQRLLDQITVLAAGESIVFGSAVHIPTRVQIRIPSQEPWSATAAPYVDWAKTDQFPIKDVITDWGLVEEKVVEKDFSAGDSQLEEETTTAPAAQGSSYPSQNGSNDLDDEIPF